MKIRRALTCGNPALYLLYLLFYRSTLMSSFVFFSQLIFQSIDFIMHLLQFLLEVE